MIPPPSTINATQTTPADITGKIRSEMKSTYSQKDGTDYTVADTSTGSRNQRVTLTLNNGIQPSPYRKTFEHLFKNTGVAFVVMNGQVSTREKTTPAPATGRRK